MSQTLESPEVSSNRALQSSADVFRSLQLAVRKRMLAGHGLGAVEDEVIDPAPVSTEKKAVLWLLAWSLLPSSYQLAEVEAHIALLTASSENRH
jgi:cytochrome c-type biogenesis protein CcmH/NrfF